MAMSSTPLPFFEIFAGEETFLPEDSKTTECLGNESSFYWLITLDGLASYNELERPQFLKQGWVLAKQGPLARQLKSNQRWRILYLEGRNEFTINRLNYVTQQVGFIHQISPEAECVKLATQLVEKNNLDSWARSALAFRWFHAWLQEAKNAKAEVLRQLGEAPSADNPCRHITSIKSLASQLGYSPAYFSSILANKWNEKDTAQCLRRARMEYAARQLLETGLRIGELASELGYASDGSFIRAFRKHFGISPEKYRKTYAEISEN